MFLFTTDAIIEVLVGDFLLFRGTFLLRADLLRAQLVLVELGLAHNYGHFHTVVEAHAVLLLIPNAFLQGLVGDFILFRGTFLLRADLLRAQMVIAEHGLAPNFGHHNTVVEAVAVLLSTRDAIIVVLVGDFIL